MVTENRKQKETQEYNKKYYGENAERLSNERKKRYHNDPEYSGKLKAYSRSYREKNRKLDGFVGDFRGRKKGPLPPIEIKINGKKVTVFTTGFVAKQLGIATSTLRSWVKKELVPETGIWLAKRRYWTKGMIEAIEKARELCSIESVGQYNKSNFAESVRNYWPKGEEKWEVVKRELKPKKKFQNQK